MISYPKTPLPELFQKDGCLYSLLRRSGNLAIYQIERLSPGYVHGYEIIRLRAGKEPETWSYSGIAAAKAKFIALDGSLET